MVPSYDGDDVPDDDTVVPDDDTVVPDDETVIPDEQVDPDTLPTPEELYPEFSAAMDVSLPDCDWEAIEVTTDDGYILTLFHVWKAD